MQLRWLMLAAACGWSCLATTPGFAAAVGPEVAARLATNARLHVVVALQPQPQPRSGASTARRRQAAIAGQRANVIEQVRGQVAGEDLEVGHQFALANGFTASVSAAGLRALAHHPGVLRIDAARQGGAALAQSAAQIRADIVRALGVTGAGVGIAVLDTAIDTAHPDLQGRITAQECFCSSNCCPGGVSRLSGPGSASGTVPVHGTHVAGILVSQGDQRIADIGIAPGAQLTALRVLNDQARGDLGDWVAALDWLAAHAAELEPRVRLVNMSLASNEAYAPGCESVDATNMLFRDVIEALRAQGTLVLAAAGNSANPYKLTSPACVSPALAVGAVDPNDLVAPFSNSAWSLALFAPGVGIRSTAPKAATAVLSGTSMATPHAAGVAALLWGAAPDLAPDEVAGFLRTTGVPVLDVRNGWWFARLDALAAYQALQFSGTLVRGGGSRLTDCLVEWQFAPRAMVRMRSRPLALCRDGDPGCDRDTSAGQCTFELALCFNVPDGRIPFCRTNDPITRLTLFVPAATPPDPIDAGNAAALADVLPATPLADQKACSKPIRLTVPVGASGRGVRSVRLTAESLGRRDSDRAHLICDAALPP
ncbi:MAG: S8 family serine peptidase [Deltaproteobacteria bacterium]|nr:S8 family serine peptidase [Deltaproteobacteria bacterium]